MGFFNILEMARTYGVQRLVYASSSSVYGDCNQIPFSENQQVDTPVSFYAATKKSNELMAYTYSHLYGLQTIGLRFFTVYGPWGRPDMAVWLFTKAILRNEPVRIFNQGRLKRDFFYVNDVIKGIETSLKQENFERYEIFNLGSGRAVSVIKMLEILERILGRKAIKEMMPHQCGDVSETMANTAKANNILGYSHITSLEDGLKSFVDWYIDYISQKN